MGRNRRKGRGIDAYSRPLAFGSERANGVFGWPRPVRSWAADSPCIARLGKSAVAPWREGFWWAQPTLRGEPAAAPLALSGSHV